MPRGQEITPGRRLRLDRRKAGLSQEGLAQLLGCTLEEVSAMENNKVQLSTAAEAFLASPPAKVPSSKPRPPRKPPAPEKPPEEREEGAGEPPLPEPEEQREGPGPADRAPSPRPRPAQLGKGEIEELEIALLHFFAGQEFLIPAPDGESQRAAVIPGVAQALGMLDPFDGEIVKIYAPGMAHAWAELARVNPTVRKILVGLTYGGAYRGVVAATMPAVLAIAAHHGMLGLGGGSQNGAREHYDIQQDGNPDEIVARCTNCGLEWPRRSVGLIPPNCSVCNGTVDFFGVAS